MSDIFLEILRTVVMLGMLLYLLWFGKKERMVRLPGWSLIVAGFTLLVFGSAIDVTDEIYSLNRFVVIGDTPWQGFLEKVVGFLLGFVLLAIGFLKWLPAISQHQHLMAMTARLKRAREELEQKVEERTRELAKTANFLQSIFNAITDGISVIDRDFTVIDANKGMLDA